MKKVVWRLLVLALLALGTPALADVRVIGTASQGQYRYDEATKTLTLDGLTLNGTIVSDVDGLTVRIQGDCRITPGVADDAGFVQKGGVATLTSAEGGTLRVTTTGTSVSSGIEGQGKTTLVFDDCDVTLEIGDYNGTGVLSQDAILVKNGSNLTSTGGLYALNAAANLQIEDSEVTASASTQTIYCGGTIALYTSEISATCTGNDLSYGAVFGGSVIVEETRLTAKGPAFSVRADKDVRIEQSVVNFESTKNAPSNGVFHAAISSDDSDVIIDRSTVTGTSKAISIWAYKGEVQILNGSTVDVASDAWQAIRAETLTISASTVDALCSGSSALSARYDLLIEKGSVVHAGGRSADALVSNAVFANRSIAIEDSKLTVDNARYLGVTLDASGNKTLVVKGESEIEVLSNGDALSDYYCRNIELHPAQGRQLEVWYGESADTDARYGRYGSQTTVDYRPLTDRYLHIFASPWQAPAPARLALEATMEVQGRAYTAMAFDFALSDADGVVLQKQRNEAPNDSGVATVRFDEITYTAEGVYHYRISAFRNALPGVTYDSRVFDVEVTVALDAHGDLGATASGEAAHFVHLYAPAPATYAIRGSKTLTGRLLKPDAFTFDLVSIQGLDGLTPTESAYADQTRNGGESGGAIVFAPIDYDEEGTWYYHVCERLPDEADRLPGVEYDTTQYIVAVTVTDNVKKGALEAKPVCYTVEFHEDGSFAGVKRASALSFVNVYAKAPVELPATGDPSRPALYALALCVSAAALVLLRRRFRA